MANEDEKPALQNQKIQTVWRTLRIASKDHLMKLDKIDDGKNLDSLLNTGDGSNDLKGDGTEHAVQQSDPDPTNEDPSKESGNNTTSQSQ